MRHHRRWSLPLGVLALAALAGYGPARAGIPEAVLPAAGALCAAEEPGGKQAPIPLDSLGALVAATRQAVPSEEGFRLYSLRCTYPITVLHFPDEAAMLQHLARVMCWFDIPDGARHCRGSIEEARETIGKALGPENKVGAAQYTLAQVAETFTACCPAAGTPPWAPAEERLLARLAAAGLVRRVGPKCEAPRPGSLVVVYGREGADSLHHELNHALYAQAAGYRKAVDQAWKTRLTAAEREGFSKALGAMGYNTQNRRLMRSEFSAYACAGPLTLKCRSEVLEWVRAREREFFPALQEGDSAGRGGTPSEVPSQPADRGPAAAPR